MRIQSWVNYPFWKKVKRLNSWVWRRLTIILNYSLKTRRWKIIKLPIKLLIWPMEKRRCPLSFSLATGLMFADHTMSIYQTSTVPGSSTTFTARGTRCRTTVTAWSYKWILKILRKQGRIATSFRSKTREKCPVTDQITWLRRRNTTVARNNTTPSTVTPRTIWYFWRVRISGMRARSCICWLLTRKWTQIHSW